MLLIATSAVDLDTDMAIQEIIRGPQFAHVTMLTIACVAFPPCSVICLLGRGACAGVDVGGAFG